MQDSEKSASFSEIKAYWREVRKEAAHTTNAELGLNSRVRIVIRVVAVVALLGALALWGSDDASRDETICSRSVRRTCPCGMAIFVWVAFVCCSREQRHNKDQENRRSGNGENTDVEVRGRSRIAHCQRPHEPHRPSCNPRDSSNVSCRNPKSQLNPESQGMRYSNPLCRTNVRRWLDQRVGFSLVL